MDQVVATSAAFAIILFAASGTLAQSTTALEGQKPENNVTSHVTAGDPILEKFDYRVLHRKYFVAEGNMTKGWPGWRATIPLGTKLTRSPSNKGLKACADDTALSTWGGGMRPACAYDDNLDGYFDRIAVSGGSAGKVGATKYQEVAEDVVVDGEGFKQVFYLTGITGSTLKISYREFKDDFARPAFTQDLEFGLTSVFPQEISFKGYRLRVIAANADGLSYSVLGQSN